VLNLAGFAIASATSPMPVEARRQFSFLFGLIRAFIVRLPARWDEFSSRTLRQKSPKILINFFLKNGNYGKKNKNLT